jgi:hypothetical protein
MAIWQVPIELVPVNWAEANNYSSELLYDEDGFDTTCAWRGNQPSQDLDLVFSRVLPKAESWSEDLTIYGCDKKHDINIWHEEGLIFSIGFRLDLRENVAGLMNSLVNSAIELNCVIFIPGQHVLFKPNVFELKQYVLKSNAARFVKDPEAFLNEII